MSALNPPSVNVVIVPKMCSFSYLASIFVQNVDEPL